MKKTLLLCIAAMTMCAAALYSCDKGNGEDPGTEIPVTPTPGGDEEQGVEVNGVVWSTRNVDTFRKFVEKPTDIGKLYQFNRTTAWAAEAALISYPEGVKWDENMYEATEWSPENDPCPEGWRLPLFDELRALGDRTKVALKWDGGRLTFTDNETKKSVFLVVTGMRISSSQFVEGGKYGCYWSSEVAGAGTGNGYHIRFRTGDNMPEMTYSSTFRNAYSVRCVRD